MNFTTEAVCRSNRESPECGRQAAGVMLDEIYKEEGKYLYDRIDNYYTHPIKLTRKMTEYLEVLRDAQ